MSEWWFIILLAVITLFAVTVIVYPLRRSAYSLGLIPIVVSLAAGGYYYWGGFAKWQEHIQHNESQKLAQEMLKSIKTPQELIDKLRLKLDDSPKSAKGWYLLGRLYTSQNDRQNALAAFAKAHQLNPEDEQFTVHYAHSLWQMNHQQFNAEIIHVFKQLVQKNPNQPDALAMLAMNAFMSHDYQEAIEYWQRLLRLAPEHSEESMAIRKAIVNAQEHINNKGSKIND